MRLANLVSRLSDFSVVSMALLKSTLTYSSEF